MKYLRLTAKLLAPLMIQQKRQSNAPQGLPYLSGSTLRGALAAKLILAGCSPEHKDFRSVFIEDPVCFPNLLPTDNETVSSHVLPLSSISCKRNPGFNKDDNHGVADTLAVAAVSREKKEPADDSFLSCPVCGNEMKSLTGFWNADENDPCRFQPTMLYNRHTGIDRATGTIATSIFFITQAVADFHKTTGSEDYQQQYLCGGMYVSDKQYELLEPFIQGPLFAGADRTSGMGELDLAIREEPAPDFDLEAWDRDFRKKIESVSKHDTHQHPLKDMMSGIYFSIKLESDAILTDAFLRPSSDMELTFNDIVPILKIAKSKTIRGWNSAWGLPKPDDIGLSMGSVFLFQYTGDSPDGLENFLNELVVKGIGLRREEGFGQVSICEPLHTIMEVI